MILIKILVLAFTFANCVIIERSMAYQTLAIDFQSGSLYDLSGHLSKDCQELSISDNEGSSITPMTMITFYFTYKVTILRCHYCNIRYMHRQPNIFNYFRNEKSESKGKQQTCGNQLKRRVDREFHVDQTHDPSAEKGFIIHVNSL